MGDLIDHLDQSKAAEPGIEHILADRGLEACPDADERILRIRRFSVLAHDYRPVL